MELKDQIVSIVYQSPTGMSPLQIVEALESHYNIKSNSKAVLQVLEKNRKLFTEIDGRFKSPAGYESK